MTEKLYAVLSSGKISAVEGVGGDVVEDSDGMHFNMSGYEMIPKSTFEGYFILKVYYANGYLYILYY